MDVTLFQTWISANPSLALGGAIVLFVLIYLLARQIFGRGLTYVAGLTKNKYDDIIVQKLRPYRAALLAPFIILYVFAYLAKDYQVIIEKISLFFILWLSLATVIGLITAINQIYESSPSFTGISIQGYLDIIKILAVVVSVILSISMLTDESPILLLSGLGALTAVLLLIFQDTIMALVASIQISAQNLVKEGDWLEVPSYDADGVIINMSLHAIKVQNWDKTITIIPTHKMIDTAYKNWRGMEESGGRRIMRSIPLDQNSIKFCTPQMINRYARIELIADMVAERRKSSLALKNGKNSNDSPLDSAMVTNVEIFRAYVEAYLKSHPDIHTHEMDFLVRELAPSSAGLPIELYVFTKTTKWNEYERIQAEIIDHLLAAAGFFDLRIFQQPTGSDFARGLMGAQKALQ
jgi:miniconductance mechanosensitive channel